MATQLYKFGEYKRKFMPEANENVLHNAAMAAALAANVAIGTSATAQASSNEMPASREEIEMALQSLEHGKMFKQKYDGDISNIVGIGKYNYPLYKPGSQELEEYTNALQNAREKHLKLFTANGLWYANPEVIDHEAQKEADAVMPMEMMTPNEVTLDASGQQAGVPKHLNTVTTNQSTVEQPTAPKISPQDLSSFVAQARGYWKMRAKGGQMTVMINKQPVIYRSEREFVRQYAALQYKNFLKSHGGIKQDVPDRLIDDAIQNAMARGN